jgi:Zn-dependent protease with chaperone function
MASQSSISSTPPWRALALVALIVIALVLLGYWLLGSLSGWAATKLPYDLELRVGELLAGADTTTTDEERKLQELVDDLAMHAPATPLRHQVHVVENDAVNAVALPGAHILVFRGLLNEVASENELAMILGHELAHSLHRDHLRALGRRAALALVVMSLGGDGLAQRILSGGLETFDLKFSRDQESAADALGLQLLHGHYGHVGGATDFFERRLADPAPPEFFSSHPLSRRRIEDIGRLAAERGYRSEATTPW